MTPFEKIMQGAKEALDWVRNPQDSDAMVNCPACGLRLTSSMSYSCPRKDCPIFPQTS